MKFDPQAYGPRVADILALAEDGQRLMPLAEGRCCSPAALRKLQSTTAADLFPAARAPEAALSGLYLYFSCFDQSHEISQSIDTAEGSFWHGILHRQEPDANNARYWFRRVPSHPIFAGLADAASDIGARYPEDAASNSPWSGGHWDPVRFIELCDRARREQGLPLEKMALEIQRAEWQLLFDYCAAAEGHQAGEPRTLKKVWILVVIVAIAAGAWVYNRKPDLPAVPFTKVVRENLVSTLSANGKVEPFEWSAVHAESAGLIDRTSVQQGQSVAAGAPLAIMRVSGVQADMAAADSQIARARAALADIERGGHSAELADLANELQHARFEKQAAQRDLDALQRLLQKNAATPFEVEAARNKVTEAQIQIDAATRKKAALTNADDKSVAEAQLKQGEAARAAAERRAGQAQIRSPIAGVVYNLAVRPGAYVDIGDLIANVGRLDRLRVRVYVDEPELGRLAIGQPVTITWEAIPREKWSGVVDRTPSEIIALGTRQVGEVLCEIDNTNGKLVPGVNVNAEIRTSSAPGALTVAKEAVRRDGAGTAVFVLEDGRVHLRTVTTGISSVTRMQIVSGLKEGDSVALPIEAPLKDGDAVKAIYP